MKAKAAHYSGILFLSLLLFAAARSSLAESFEVELKDFYFQKEMIDNDPNPPTSTFYYYDYSPSRDNMGVQGTFTEEENSGVYEVIWSPPRDYYIKRDLYIEVVLSGKYSSEKKIKTMQYVYLQDTYNPENKDDLGIHTWKLIANNIPFVGMSGGKLKFELEGAFAWSHTDEYEKINQGNPRFRSIERVHGFNPEGKVSKLIVSLDLGREWWIFRPDIEVTPKEINFGNIKRFSKRTATFKISNIGNKSLKVFHVGTIADESVYIEVKDFGDSSPCWTNYYYPNASCNYMVWFMVLGNKPGEFTAKVYVQSDDPVDPTVYVNLRGSTFPTNIPSIIELLLLD